MVVQKFVRDIPYGSWKVFNRSIPLFLVFSQYLEETEEHLILFCLIKLVKSMSQKTRKSCFKLMMQNIWASSWMDELYRRDIRIVAIT